MKTNLPIEIIKGSMLLILLMLSGLTSYAAEDYDFSVENEDGKMIFYYVIDASEGTCGVMYESKWNFMYHKSGYSGDIVIPEKISYKGKSFTVIEIGWKAFFCADLTSISIPESVKSIGEYAFSESTLESIVIPDSVEQMGEYVFSECKSLKSISLSASCSQIPNFAFIGCTSLESFEVPEWILIIGSNAFSSCTSLREIVIPEGVETMGSKTVCSFDSSTFHGCTSLEKITLPNSLTLIGNNAFYGCTSLKEVTIGNKTEEIGPGAFHGCPLENIYCPCVTPPDFYHNTLNQTFDSKDYQDATVHVPEEALESYKTDSNWKNFWFINGYAFNGIERVCYDDNSIFRVTDLSGREINAHASLYDLESLPKGIFVVNGKKILKK